MQDPFARKGGGYDIVPGQRLKGTVRGLFKAEGEDFVTQPVDALPLAFTGIPGDFHAGHTRHSGGREPWYKRGTEMRNERQVSLLAPQDMRRIARALGIEALKPEWIGGNMLLDGIEDFTMLPPRTLLFFEGGATVKIDGDNAPCRLSGRSIAAHIGNRPDIELAFTQAAQHLRGLVGWVEKEGVVRVGEAFEARLPPQWIYRAN